MDQKRFDELLAKYLTDSLAQDEQCDLESYVAHDPQAKTKLDMSSVAWGKCGALAKFKSFEKCKSTDFGKVLARTSRAHTIGALRIEWHKWMAAASVLVILTISGWYLHQNVAGFGKWESVASGSQSKLITLPDNSSVMLNKGSRIVFLSKMDALERVVKLQGEAFFEVNRDTLHAFIVKTGQANVKVLGTAFNVRTDKKNQLTEVFVKKGKVALGDGKKSVELDPFDVGRLEHGKLYKETIIDENVLFWKTGQLVFNNNTIGEVLEVLVTTFPEIQTVDVLNIDTLTRVTTRFDNPELNDVLAELQLHLNVNVELRDGTLVVR